MGVITLLVVAALGYLINENRRLQQQAYAELEKQRQTLVQKGQSLRENAKTVLANGRDDPIKDVTALRNLALALNLNREDTEAAKITRNLLLQRVWCPPQRRKRGIDETHYWQRPSLREEAIAKSLRRQVTVSCCFGMGRESLLRLLVI